jgi:hypothetical protein
MAVDMNIMGTPVTPDMIRKTIRQWHGANQTNGDTLTRKVLNVPEDQEAPVYRPEKNPWPRLMYHPGFKSHVLEETPEAIANMERTQAKFLKKARNQAEMDQLLALGYLTKPPHAMNAAPPEDWMEDERGFREFTQPELPEGEMDEMEAEMSAVPVKRGPGRPPKIHPDPAA